jgi:HEAT repeat protein
MRHVTAALLFGWLLLCGSRAPAQADDDAKAQVAEDEKLLQSRKVPADGPGLLRLFRAQTATAAEEERARALCRKLGDDVFRVRERAATDLIAMGPKALPALRHTVATAELEAQRRAQRCIQSIESRITGDLLAAAARLVEVRRPAGASAVLLEYLPSARDADVEEAVLVTLWGLARHAGKPDAALAAALQDKEAARRAAAARVLGQFGDEGQRARVRKLLTDASPAVRFRAAQGLLAAREVAALPALIALLENGPLDLARQGEEILSELAGKQAPAAPLPEDVERRRKCQKAWLAWWEGQKGHVDLSKSDLGLSPSDPAARVKGVARRFLNSILHQDLAAMRLCIDLPFSVVGLIELKTKQEFDQLFQGVVAQPKKVGSFTFVKLTRPEEYVKTEGGKMLQKFIDAVPRGQLRVLYVRTSEQGGRQETAVLLVRLVGARARVVGIGMLDAPFKK